MYFDEQQDVLNQIPKYTDIQNYVFKTDSINAYSDTGDTILFPVPKVLLQLYQQHTGIKFKIEFKKWTLGTTKNLIEEYSNINEIISSVFYTEENNINKLYVVHVTRGSELFEMAKNHEKFDKNIGLALQMEQNHKIAVIKVNESTTVVFTNKYDTLEMQAYYSIVPIVFSKEKLPEKLIKSFLELYNKNYSQIIDNIYILFKDIDVTEIKMKHLKTNLTTLFKNPNKINQIENDIKSLNQTLNSYYDEITRILANIKDKELRKLILIGQDFEQVTLELIEYMSTNKFITDIDIQGNELHVTVKTPLYFADEKFIQKLFDTPKSYINEKSKEVKALIKEVFLDKKSIIIVKCKIVININSIANINTGTRMDGIRSIIYATHLYPNQFFTDSVPQPHLVYYNCFGANETHLLKTVQNNDIIGLIAQAIASCQNINFGDSAVSNKFINDIETNYANKKFIYDEEIKEQISYNEWKKRRFPNETNTD